LATSEADAPQGLADHNGPTMARETVRGAPWTSELEDVLEQWHRRAWAAQVAHYKVASVLRRRNLALGVPVVILTTAVGTSLFATLNHANLALGLRITVGAVSIAAAILAAVQNFFGFAQLADKHVLAADWYSAIRRRIEQLQAVNPEWRGDPVKTIDGLRKEMNTVGSQFPEIGQDLWTKVAGSFGVRDRPSPQS
jgi:hypothetical protein